MARRKNQYVQNSWKRLSDIQRKKGNDWYTHYYQYLTSLAYQLFEWDNLPDSVDPRYLEMSYQNAYVHGNTFKNCVAA